MPDTLPLVSVIIPAYNAGGTIARALDSALQQDYPATELVIADDGSTDDTRRIVEQYRARDPRVRYVWQANRGIGGARNLAIAQAGGEYLALLDADDEWRPGKLRRQVEILTRYPAVDLVFTNGLEITVSNGRSRAQAERYAAAMQSLRREATEVFADGFVLGRNLRRVLFQQNFIFAGSAMLRRRTFERFGYFMTDAGPEDLDLWVRASRSATFAYCASVFAIHYNYPANTTASEAWQRAMVRFYQRYLSSPEEADLRPAAARQVSRQYRRLIFYYGRHQQPRQAVAAFRASLAGGLDGLSVLCMLGSFFGALPFKVAGRLLWP